MIIFLRKKFLSVFVCVCIMSVCFVYGMKKIEAESKVELPIIMYHNITEKGSLAGKYAVMKSQFEKDLQYIRDNGYTTVTTKDLIDYTQNGKELPEKPIMITFDDGYESFYVYAFPLLKEYNMTAVMSVIGLYADIYTEKQDHNIDYSHLNWDEIAEMAESGYVEIGNHTYDMHHNKGGRKGCHIKWGEDTETYHRVVTEDLEKLQDNLMTHLGKKTNIFAYPYGCICDEALPILKELDFKIIFTCTEKKNELSGDSEDLLSLGRFNRGSGESSKTFFDKMDKEK